MTHTMRRPKKARGNDTVVEKWQRISGYKFRYRHQFGLFTLK
jgi:hypothetical protein